MQWAVTNMKTGGFLYDWFLYPHRIAAIAPHLRAVVSPLVLDIGCGNHSPRITKHYLARCEYHGVANRRWNLDAEDDRCMNRFFQIDLNDPSALAAVPDRGYDAVICSHVLEHLKDPYSIVPAIAAKVKSGGVLYIEAPSARSARLPRARDGWGPVRGCLNFADDESHRSMVDLARVAGILEQSGLSVEGARPRRMWRRIIFLPLYLLGALTTKRFVPASLLWDVMGFAESLRAARKK
jgi:SAM-dependent methyltransferase